MTWSCERNNPKPGDHWADDLVFIGVWAFVLGVLFLAGYLGLDR